MNRTLLARTITAQRAKLLAVALALAAWGFITPMIYATFGQDLRELVAGNPLIRQFSRFGGGDLFSLPGSIALGFIHPIAVALISVFAVGFAAAAVAGERQRGTLEVLLARPVSRRSLYLTLLVAVSLFIAVAVAAMIAGALASAAAWDVIDELELANVPLLWLNGCLLFGALASLALAASVSFDRLTPALAITLAITILSYFLEVVGSLWPDAEWLQPYSLFHYLQPSDVLTDGLPASHVAVLAGTIVAAVVYAVAVFPRRDIAAPI